MDWKDQVSRRSEETIYQGIAAAVNDFVRSEELKPGDRLPTIRELAKILNVSPMTVSKAYVLLSDQGLVVTRRGGGTIVADKGAEKLSDPAVTLPSKLHTTRSNWFAERMSRVAMAPGAISFLGGYPSIRDIDTDFLSDCVAKAISGGADSVFRYVNPAGVPILLELLSEKCERFGIQAAPAQICVTSGAQQAIDIVSRTLLSQGDPILVEAPTYFAALDTFRTQGLKMIPLPMEQGGVDPERFAEAAKRHKARAFYTTPNCHNPTGITTSKERREAIAETCKRLGILIIEDDYCPELLFRGGRPTSYFELCRDTRNVYYVNSLSKLHFPGLRMGFVATLNDNLRQIVSVKASTDLHTSGVLQVSAAEYLKSEQYKEYSDQLTEKLRAKSESVRKLVQRHLGEQTFVEAAAGGLNFWILLQREAGDQDVFYSAVNNSVAFSAGSIFFPDQGMADGIRISFGLTPEEDLEEGIKRVAKAVDEIETSPTPNFLIPA